MKKYGSVLLALIVIILLWQSAALVVNRPFLPTPGKTLTAGILLAQRGVLWMHLRASLLRILWALLAGGLPAVLLGIAAGRSVKLGAFVTPFVYLIHPLPKAAFLPIIILFFGLGEASKIFLVAFTIFSQILVTMRDAAKQVDDELLDVLKTLKANGIERFVHLIWPSCLPAFFSGFRVSLGTAIAVLFIAETFAAELGLGYLIMDAWIRVAYAEMYAAIGTLGLVGLLLFFLTDLAENLSCPWNRAKTFTFYTTTNSTNRLRRHK
jgi:NitT/TauT family transport system permease protein